MCKYNANAFMSVFALLIVYAYIIHILRETFKYFKGFELSFHVVFS